MFPVRAAHRRWVVLLVAAALFAVPLGTVRHATASDGTLVLAALKVLDEEYVDPVQPVTLLNAAIATLRKATNQSSAVLPDIPAGASRADAEISFTSEFERAAQLTPAGETQLAYEATAGMLASLHDSHTAFLDPKQYLESRQQILGRPGFTGIGVVITARKDAAGDAWIFVEDVFSGSPAEAAGVKRFDRIVQVDGKSLKNVTSLEASQFIRGPAGSSAVLTILRGNRTLTIEVIRASIREHPVEARFVDQPPTVAQTPQSHPQLAIPPSPSRDGAVRIFVNGDLVKNDVPPRFENGHVLVPLRGVFERLGAIVEFYPGNQQILATRGAQTIRLTIGSRQASVNGIPAVLDAPASIVAGRVLVPLRFISESLGASIQWSEASRAILVNSTNGPEQGGIAYVKLTGFTRGASFQLKIALRQLALQRPIRSIVFDLRANPGGLIHEAVAIGSLFLPPRTILSKITERGHSPSVLQTAGTPLFSKTPLVVLIDGSSASASEILTGAFKDHHRATIVGEKSAGALGGSVTVPLPDRTGMSVTVERIVTPQGALVEGVGISPDVNVSLTVSDMVRGEDTQLQAALRVLAALDRHPASRAA